MGRFVNREKRKNSLLWGVISGVGIALLSSAVLTYLQTVLTQKGTLLIENAGVFAFTIRTISAFAGSLLAIVLSQEKTVPIVGIVACVYLVILLGIGILFFDEAVRNFAAGAGSVLLGGILSILVRLKPQNKQKISHLTRR